MRTNTIIQVLVLAAFLASCDWPFDYTRRLEWSGATPTGCGDGVLDPDEMCDDGNREDGDDCSANCLSTPVLLVNHMTDQAQFHPRIDGTNDGFTVAFTSDSVPDIEPSIHVRAVKLDPDGHIQSTAGGPWWMKMNILEPHASNQERPDVAIYGGSFVAVWLDFNNSITEGPGDVRVRLVDNTGFGDPEQTLNATLEEAQIEAVIAGNNTNTMIAAWTSHRASPQDVRCRRVVDGAPAAEEEVTCSEATDGDQNQPAVAMAADGRYAVAWTGQDANGRGVFVRFFGSDGSPASGDIAANTTTNGEQDHPAIAWDTAGRLLVVWRHIPPGGQSSVRGRLFSSPGTPAGDDFMVSEITSWDTASTIPDVAGDAGHDGAGVFIVAWFTPGTGVRARLVSGPNAFAVNRVNERTPGQPAFTDTGEFPVNPEPYPQMDEAKVAVGQSGKALVVWVDESTGGESFGDIRGRIIPTN